MKELFVVLVGALALGLCVPVQAEEPVEVQAPAAAGDETGVLQQGQQVPSASEEVSNCGAEVSSQLNLKVTTSFGGWQDGFACVSDSVCGGCPGYLQCAVPREDGCCYPELPQCVSSCTWGCGALCAL
jgi:hypothetical protein